MIIKKTVQKEVEIIDDITCNKCGKSLGVDIGGGSRNFHGLHGNVRGGFGSPALEDFTTYKFDVCEPCLTEWFKTFTIKPEEEPHGLIG